MEEALGGAAATAAMMLLGFPSDALDAAEAEGGSAWSVIPVMSEGGKAGALCGEVEWSGSRSGKDAFGFGTLPDWVVALVVGESMELEACRATGEGEIGCEIEGKANSEGSGARDEGFGDSGLSKRLGMMLSASMSPEGDSPWASRSLVEVSGDVGGRCVWPTWGSAWVEGAPAGVALDWLL